MWFSVTWKVEIPKASSQSNDFKTKKIFVGGIPTSVKEDEFKNFFSKYGKVVEHEIIRDHATKRSRGFGFIVFDSDKVVDNILADGNMVDMEGTKVEIKKAEPKKASNPAPGPAYGSEFRPPYAMMVLVALVIMVVLLVVLVQLLLGLSEVLAVDLEIMVFMVVVLLILVVVIGGLVGVGVVVSLVIVEIHHLVILADLVPMLVQVVVMIQARVLVLVDQVDYMVVEQDIEAVVAIILMQGAIVSRKALPGLDAVSFDVKLAQGSVQLHGGLGSG
ncbi:hypothetical protein PTKIN_Ptkin12aG0061400 [Pterospermum kingtungense]